mgnify:CR=1 FL=1
MSEEQKQSLEKQEEIKPIVICQFVFHPQTGEIVAGYHDDLSVQDLMKIKFMVEETLSGKQKTMPLI